MNWVRNAFQCDDISVDCNSGYVTPGKGEAAAGERGAPSGAARSKPGTRRSPSGDRAGTSVFSRGVPAFQIPRWRALLQPVTHGSVCVPSHTGPLQHAGFVVQTMNSS